MLHQFKISLYAYYKILHSNLYVCRIHLLEGKETVNAASSRFVQQEPAAWQQQQFEIQGIILVWNGSITVSIL